MTTKIEHQTQTEDFCCLIRNGEFYEIPIKRAIEEILYAYLYNITTYDPAKCSHLCSELCRMIRDKAKEIEQRFYGNVCYKCEINRNNHPDITIDSKYNMPITQNIHSTNTFNEISVNRSALIKTDINNNVPNIKETANFESDRKIHETYNLSKTLINNPNENSNHNSNYIPFNDHLPISQVDRSFEVRLNDSKAECKINNNYSNQNCQLTRKINNSDNLKYPEWGRHKLVVNVVIGQDTNQSFQMACRSLTDPCLDGMASGVYRNRAIFAIAIVYGIGKQNLNI